MFGHSWRVGRVAGVEISVDSSWTVIALLITYSLYLNLSSQYPYLSHAEGIALAFAAALLFFASVLTHELAHAVTARRRGIAVRGITLFLFGGATQARIDAGTPADEFLITAAGPATSLALAGIFGTVAIVGRGILPRPIAGTIGYLGWINALLAVFNLLPGFPLDGGRLLRSVIWRSTGSLERATRAASRAGEAVGYLLMGVGMVQIFSGYVVGGVWFAAIGWFLAQAARSSRAELHVRRLLQDADAADVMTRALVPIPSDISVRTAVDEFFMRQDQAEFPVASDGTIVGVITLAHVKRVAREEWDARTVGDAMSRLEDDPVVGPSTSMDRVIAILDEQHEPVAVVDGGVLVGIITTPDVARWLNRRQAIEGPGAD